MKKSSLIVILVCLFILLVSLGAAAQDGKIEDQFELKKDSWIANYPVNWDHEKEIEYIKKKKNPMVASGLASVVPSLGHAYAGNWGRGLKFLVAEAAESFIMVWGLSEHRVERYNDGYDTYYEYEKNSPMLGSLAWMALIGTKYWEIFDAHQTAEVENAKLKHQISINASKDRVAFSANYSF